MEDQLPRKLAAIFYADVAGYSRLTDEDEEETHQKLSEYLDLIRDSIGQYQGSVDHYAGDAVLADFSTVTNALECAISIQSSLTIQNKDLPEERKLQFRIGINLGEVIVDRDEIYGNGVNIAGRLEGLADAGGVCVSDAVRTAIGNKLPLDFEFMGEQSVKNIKQPIRAYQVRLRSGKPPEIILPERQGLELPAEPSIAVLPFINMSGDPEQEYFSDGITEDIITALSRLPRIFVVARHSTHMYKGQAVEIRRVGREQGVRFVLEGSVRKSGNRIRISAQLIDAKTGNHRWADRYDRELDDIFVVQDEITREVTIAVQVEISAGEQARLWAGGTDNLDAWECVVRGNEYLHLNGREDNQEARRLAKKAVSYDPGYANAWVLLGFTYYVEVLWHWSASREKSLTTAEEAAVKAMALEEFNPDALSLLACVKTEQAAFEEAVEISRKAVSLTPRHSPNLAIYAVTLLRAGEYQAAVQKIKTAIRLSPFCPAWYMHVLGSCSFAIGEYEQAANAYQACLAASDPDSAFMPIVRVWLAICLSSAGHNNAAKSASEEVFRLDPKFHIDDWRQFRRIDPALQDRAVRIWNQLVSE